jgi:hypothetical protein
LVTLTFLSGQVSSRARPTRSTAGSRLAEAIAAEKLDEYGDSCRRFIQPRGAKTSAKRKRLATDVSLGDAADAIDTDTEDKTFAMSVSEGGCDDDSSDSGSDDVQIGNEEVSIISFDPSSFKLIHYKSKIANMLPSKTIPDVKNRKRHALKPKNKKLSAAAAPPRKKARTMSDTEVEIIGGNAAMRRTTVSPASSFQVSYPVPVKVRKVL